MIGGLLGAFCSRSVSGLSWAAMSDEPKAPARPPDPADEQEERLYPDCPFDPERKAAILREVKIAQDMREMMAREIKGKPQ